MTTAVLSAMQWQAGFCRSIKAPFSAAVIEAVLADVRAGGASATLFEAWAGADAQTLVREAVPLRVLGGLHLLVLKGEEPALAAVYPQDGSDGDGEAAARLIPEVMRRRADQRCSTMAPDSNSSTSSSR